MFKLLETIARVADTIPTSPLSLIGLPISTGPIPPSRPWPGSGRAEGDVALVKVVIHLPGG
ncbi:MAG TPA: hypothetical protein VK196_01755 [Magnetospirillum sp.]|nr:hypothetical protein [Magnetospirillum sp.]